MDLMSQQSSEGNDVALLWPGEIKLLNHKTRIKYCGKINDIASFEIKNPLPISYDEGIVNIDRFTQSGCAIAYKELLGDWKPDVIHIHTLMGLHKEFIIAAKQCGIRLVFSAHDFFPICPKITMFRHNQVCASIGSCDECPECNMTAFAMWKGWILQHPLYMKMKDSSVVKKMRKKHRDSFLSGEIPGIANKSNLSANKPVDYKQLRGYYRQLLNMMDCLHFNSNLTRHVYETYLGTFPSQTIAITHLDIKDNRQKKTFNKRLQLAYLGPQGGAKGFFFLRRHSTNCGKSEKILN
jgi:hypothetical protein